MIGIDVYSSRQLQAVVLALHGAGKDIQSRIRAETRAEMVPAWQHDLVQHATTRLEVRLAETGRAKVSNQNVTLTAGSVKGSKTADLRILNRPVEFGANQAKRATYDRRSRKGHVSSVTRRINTGFRPNRRKGYVVYPTASELIPRLVSLWVQTAVREFHDAFEKGAGHG